MVITSETRNMSKNKLEEIQHKKHRYRKSKMNGNCYEKKRTF